METSNLPEDESINVSSVVRNGPINNSNPYARNRSTHILTERTSEPPPPARQPPPRMMLPPNDDDDDMIEDYLNDHYDHEPPEDLDDYENYVPSQTIQPSNTRPETMAVRPTTVFREEDSGNDSDDALMKAHSIRQAAETNRPKQDLYKFERYLEHSQWRTEKTNSPMRAKKWKRNDTSNTCEENEDGFHSSSRNVPSSRTSLPSTPDAMLLSFLQQRHEGTTTYRKQQPVQRRRCVLSPSPVAGNECYPMTLGDGVRVFLPIQNPSNPARNGSVGNPSNPSAVASANCLGVPMDVLLDRVHMKRRKREYEKVVQESSFFTDRHSSHDIQTKDHSTIQAKSPTSVTKLEDIESSMLWVDKHAPRCFAHLLSDERCNREVVRALRAWDPYVFHRDPPKRPDYFVQHQRNQANSAKDGDPREEGHGKKELKSKDKRPDETSRVILLSGPPGVGKTTLAHIVARHVGYRPIEVNGSDERTETALTDRVVRAMESSTLHFGTHVDANRPNCLILDEIDGADAVKSIESLVQIIRAEIPSAQKGSSKRKTPYLRRPIIFICNNKFVPALKPLLPYAKQFDIHPPATPRLVARLRTVLNLEHMSVSTGGNSLLNQLVISSCGDIRSCLYTLQFASSQAKERSNSVLHSSMMNGETSNTFDISAALHSALSGNGMKDERNDIVGTVSTIFHKEKDADPIASSSQLKLGRHDRSSSMVKVLAMVRSFGDNSRVLDSLFVNLLRVSFIDPSFDRSFAALEWMSGADVYRSNKQLSSPDGYSVEAMHTPTVAAAVHVLCRVEQTQDLMYSTRELTDSQYRMESNISLMQKFMSGMSFRAKSTRIGLYPTATETIPYSLWILSAGEGSAGLNRTVTSQDLLRKGECEAFEHHASILRALGLTYVAIQDDVLHGRSHQSGKFQRAGIDPPIDRLVQFNDLPNYRSEISLAIKQMLSRKAVLAPTSHTPEASSEPITNSKRKAPSSKECKENFLLVGAKKAKALRSARTAARVGCNHVALTSSDSKGMNNCRLSNTGSGIPMSDVVRLKYVKGFTQAVSMPCRLEDLS